MTQVRWILAALLLGCLGGLFFIVVYSYKESPKYRVNEVAAGASLLSLASCQAQIQSNGTIDCDGDGIGEYGTFLEVTGSVPARRGFFPGTPAGSDFSKQGKVVDPAGLSRVFANVDSRGFVNKAGYFFVICLPDDSRAAGFVHETGPAAKPGLSGRVGVDLAEKRWCAYAWPVSRGNSGLRCYFINESGHLLRSDNEVAKWGGTTRPMAPDSALLGPGITARVAIGTRGRDGDYWRIVK